jgi:hypothetical protein
MVAKALAPGPVPCVTSLVPVVATYQVVPAAATGMVATKNRLSVNISIVIRANILFFMATSLNIMLKIFRTLKTMNKKKIGD